MDVAGSFLGKAGGEGKKERGAEGKRGPFSVMYVTLNLALVSWVGRGRTDERTFWRDLASRSRASSSPSPSSGGRETERVRGHL